MLAAIAVALVAAHGSTKPASVEIADQLARLSGHQVVLSADGADFEISDVAGEGPAMIGIVEADGNDQLALVTTRGERWRLIGPLAIPRIAGPGYKVWVIGSTVGAVLRPKRLGILRSPHR